MPETRRRCLGYLYRIYGHKTLVPRSPAIPLCYNPTESPLYYGGLADVWKGQYQGREVAAKAVRIYLTSDLERIRKVGCPQPAMSKELTGSHIEILPGSRCMGDPPSSKRTAAVRCHYDPQSIRDGIGVDGEWGYQPICEDAYPRESIGTCMFFGLRSSSSAVAHGDMVTAAGRRH